MNWRSPSEPYAYVGVALAFLAGAAFTWSVAQGLARLRHSPLHVSDEVLERLVRSHVSDVAPHPEEIDVSVENGEVRISGRLAREARDRLLHSLIDIPGVLRVRNAISSFPPGAA